jgi:ligand-binding sensor domain-containing protein
MRSITSSGRARAWQVAVILAAIVAPARAERHPIRVFTTADGLASSVVLDIAADSRGFLWFATRNGLSRFDGSEFRTYTTEDGLPNPVVNAIVETSEGDYWIATNGGGVCRLNLDAGPAIFACQNVGDTFLSNRVNVLHEDRRRRIWMGTDNGLFRMERDGRAWNIEPVVVDGLPAGLQMASRAVYEDEQGRVWVGLPQGLLRLDPDRRPTLYTLRGRGPYNVRQIVEHDGTLWVGLNFGLLAFRPETRTGAPSLVRTELHPIRGCVGADRAALSLPTTAGDACLTDARSGLASNFVGGLARTPNGQLWIATIGGLAYVDDAGFTSISTREHLAAAAVSRLVPDRHGRIWLATDAGAMRLSPQGMVTYGRNDGLGHPRVRTIFERAGRVYAVSGDWVINRFDGRGFTAFRPPVPEGAAYGYYSHGAFLDRSGRWWLLTNRGLHRLSPGSLERSVRSMPAAIYTEHDGLPHDRVDRLFEDARGDLWIATRSSEVPINLARWDRATGRIHTVRDGFGAEHQFPMAFAEDRLGAVWIGFEGGGLARYRDGRFTVFGAAHGVPISVTALHVDASGRLWIASGSAGLSRLDDVAGESLRFVRYTTADGLSSNNLQCITSDRWGRIYVGTSRGVDRLNPATRRVKHFSTSDGLAHDYVTAAVPDRAGHLWFGTNDGVSRLVPVPDAPAPIPPVWIDRVRAGGALRQVPELGASDVADLTLAAGQNHLEVAFFSTGHGTGDPLRYRYRLDGAEHEWNGPTDRRVVHYASLAPGRYRFVVEAINADGAASTAPATVSFTVLPPVWRQWWFISLGVVVMMLTLYTGHRYRLAHLLALERVRTRIAADLHDDIGGSLSRIALQSEVGRRAMEMAAVPAARTFREIGDTARTLLDELDDVVWSVDPRQDDLASVERRLREFAAEVLGAAGIRWTIHGAASLDRWSLDPASRRHLLLVLKEGVTNIARHAGTCTAHLDLRLSDGILRVELSDDGRGFDARSWPTDELGHGLDNMRARARALGGRLDIQSGDGRGTRIVLTVPMRRRWRMNMRWRTRRHIAEHRPGP